MSDEKKTKKVERTLEQQAILDNIIACLKYKKIDQKDLCEYLGKSGRHWTQIRTRSSFWGRFSFKPKGTPYHDGRECLSSCLAGEAMSFCTLQSS